LAPRLASGAGLRGVKKRRFRHAGSLARARKGGDASQNECVRAKWGGRGASCELGARRSGRRGGRMRVAEATGFVSKIKESIEVACPRYYALHHAERFFTVHRRGVSPGTISLRVDFSRLKLPGASQARHDVQVEHKLSGQPGKDQLLNLAWDPRDPTVPSFTGTLSAAENDGTTILALDGSYSPPLGVAGAAFDVVAGRRIASATIRTLLEEMKEFIESDFQTALSTDLASSPKE